MFCGNVRRPGRVSIAPVSNLGLLILSTKPLASPSIPGQGSWPAPLNHVATHAFVAKSYTVPGIGVAVGPTGVMVGVGELPGSSGVTDGVSVKVGVGVTAWSDTTIRTNQGWFPRKPMPKV